MSRAREIGGRWFDTYRNGEKASAQQLELLASAESIEIDDLLDEGLSQGLVIQRLRKALGEGVIPAQVLERQRERRIQADKQPECRLCTADGIACEGRITRHHFVNRWIMRELENYEAYATRSRCTIPVCLGRHRDLHLRTENHKSIVEYLTYDERKFAHKMLSELRDQHPKIFELLLGGDTEKVYEARLTKDFLDSKFASEGSLTSGLEAVRLETG